MDLATQRLMMSAAGAGGDPVYVDDVFSTFLYEGTGASHTINNGTDLSGEGGMVWVKGRDTAVSHVLFDTERGATKMLIANDTYDTLTISNSLTSFNSNGFTLGDYSSANGSGNDYSSWTFRKTKGFFDVVTWTGNSSTTQTISHSLGSIPGCIMAKCTSTNDNWSVYHRGLDGGNQPATHYLRLNTTDGEIDDDNKYADTEPTATNFTAGNDLNVNTRTYIAYVFAGGESTAATARSVDFDGSGDYLSVPASSDFSFGTGDFTIEGWIYKDTNSHNKCIFTLGDTGTTGGSGEATSLGLNWSNSNRLIVFGDSNYIISNSAANNTAPVGQWIHFALVKNSGVLTLYTNGVSQASYNSSQQWGAGSSNYLTIGATKYDGAFSNEWNGHISNFRVIKGTALYTSSFRPPTEPLTNITNTKLLCCNNSSTTGKTVGPTITANGDPTASTNSPFDDLSASVFGENEDQEVIKCDSYVGNALADGPEINLGWEPQWLLFKNTDSSTAYWELLDNMRGLASEGNGYFLAPNAIDSESYRTPLINLTPTGFKIRNNNANINGNNQNIIYIAIRRPDGYVGKPIEDATKCFAMDTGNGSSTIPTFDSNFIVDFALTRRPAATDNWDAVPRLLGKSYVKTNSTAAEDSDPGSYVWDSNVGWAKDNNSTHQSWMWKCHAGFDVVATTGGAYKKVAHSLAKAPDMYWVKNRSNAANWTVYHKGLNGGSNPENYYINLNSTSAESSSSSQNWGGFVPTSTHISFGNADDVGSNSSYQYLVALFASVDGISKVGYYTGNGTAGHAITVGFQPRFLIIKSTTQALGWHVFDTARGWGSGNDEKLELDSSAAQGSYDYGAPTSTGFTIAITGNSLNGNGEKYIYYAHA